MSKISKTMSDVGDAAQSTQRSLKQEVRLSSETVGLGRETMLMGHQMVYASRALGMLLAIALTLLIILETQWIRYWARKLTATK
jgi:hypothetical protein